MELLRLIAVFTVGLIAGFIGTNVGGGGLISIPALIFLGLSPQVAIATNKVGSLGVTGAGLVRFHKGGKVNYKIGVPIAIFAVIGSYFGANTLLTIPNTILEKIVGVIILAILVLVLFNKNIGVKKADRKRSRLLTFLGYLTFLFIGFEGAFFGGGFATLSIYALITIFGLTFLESAGTTKPLGVGIAIMAILVFGLRGVINWVYGASLLLGMALGSYVGAGYGIKKGNIWVKRLFVVVVVISAIKLLF
jgi:uncharacterized membrane protein YfcA